MITFVVFRVRVDFVHHPPEQDPLREGIRLPTVSRCLTQSVLVSSP